MVFSQVPLIFTTEDLDFSLKHSDSFLCSREDPFSDLVFDGSETTERNISSDCESATSASSKETADSDQKTIVSEFSIRGSRHSEVLCQLIDSF